jgi:hypothetical protein
MDMMAFLLYSKGRRAQRIISITTAFLVVHALFISAKSSGGASMR